MTCHELSLLKMKWNESWKLGLGKEGKCTYSSSINHERMKGVNLQETQRWHGIVVVDISWWKRCNHHSHGVSTETFREQLREFVTVVHPLTLAKLNQALPQTENHCHENMCNVQLKYTSAPCGFGKWNPNIKQLPTHWTQCPRHPKADNDWLMAIPSSKPTPVKPVSWARSLPARSTRHSLDRNSSTQPPRFLGM